MKFLVYFSATIILSIDFVNLNTIRSEEKIKASLNNKLILNFI